MAREPSPGDCVVVIRNTGDHPARVGDLFIVHDVDDNDPSLHGIPQGSATVADFWIPFDDVRVVEFGWGYARQYLPADVAALLSACNGIECISLNRGIKAAILDTLPDWLARVLEAIGHGT